MASMERLAAAPWLLAVLSACGSAAQPAGMTTGQLADGHPTWAERTVVALTNAVRMAPADWKARWSGGGLGADVLAGSYGPVAPVRWNPGLGRSSLAHSEDMARTPCFSHDSCDGTSWSARLRSYYTLSSAIGENIAAGYADPEAVVRAWICDAQGGACCPDGQGCDGHRRNIMSSGWQALGVGWARGGGYGQYWTQDFGGRADGEASPLVDGSHLPRGSTTLFFANVSAGAAPLSVTLVLEAAELPMAVALGGAGRGTWAAEVPRGAGCRAYHFVLSEAGGATWRYPAGGRFGTVGEGGCTAELAP